MVSTIEDRNASNSKTPISAHNILCRTFMLNASANFHSYPRPQQNYPTHISSPSTMERRADQLSPPSGRLRLTSPTPKHGLKWNPLEHLELARLGTSLGPKPNSDCVRFLTCCQRPPTVGSELKHGTARARQWIPLYRIYQRRVQRSADEGDGQEENLGSLGTG